MKSLIIFSFVLCLVHPSIQIPKFEGDCSQAQDSLGSYKDGCNYIRCDGSQNPAIIPCGLVAATCEPNKKYVGQKFDHDKMYPECCVQIICE